jgi:hypothetical protein
MNSGRRPGAGRKIVVAFVPLEITPREPLVAIAVFPASVLFVRLSVPKFGPD